jgi:hypothetical protein
MNSPHPCDSYNTWSMLTSPSPAGPVSPKLVAVGTVVVTAVAKLPDTFATGVEKFGVVERAHLLRDTNRNSAIR